MYNRAGAEATPADTGMNMGRALYDEELNARSRYAQPSIPAREAEAVAGEPEWYNKFTAPPVKYSVPTAQKERMVARNAIRNAVPENQWRPDPISEEEVDYLQSMQDQAELADFDRYVNKLIDPKRPGMMKILMDIYPDFVNRRVKQAHTDYEFAMRKQMIDTWGIQTFDDLHFMYLCDQGKISGPKLQLDYEGQVYTTGLLAPAFWKHKRGEGVRAPYASSSFGVRPQGGETWAMPDGGHAMGEERDLQQMAGRMYQVNQDQAPPWRPGIAQPPLYGRRN